jgi:Flp pilus assembly protein TadG
LGVTSASVSDAQERGLTKFGKFRKGQIAIVLTLAIATLLGVMALGADVGVMYYNWVQLQKGADAAALVGANYLNEVATGEAFASTNVNANCASQPDDAKKAACTYAMDNNLAYASLTYDEVAASATPNTPNIQVVASRSNLPYMFGRVIGLSTYNVAAAATATQGSTGATTGMFPMGMQCTAPCSLSNITPGNPVTFAAKFSPTGEASGNWQWLASGSGAKGVGDAVAGGMPGTYAIGRSVTTKPGSDSMGPISKAFDARMKTCASLSPDPCSGSNPNNIPPTDPCLVTVLAVDFTGAGGSTTLPF